MMKYKQCPECDAPHTDTKRENIQVYADRLTETRRCNRCGILYENKFELFEQERVEL